MPTFDGGHCFLTALLPINTSDVVDQNGLKSSHVQLVRDALSILPTAHQSQVTEKIPCNSPFARCTKTHFARLAVIDDVIYNGRMPTNAFLDQSDRTIPQPIDQLPGPYLMLVVDFDAPEGNDAELRGYLRGIWNMMEADLGPIFRNCFGYSARATSADGFADYIIGCQVETTMPFNDYWPGLPPLPSLSFPALGVTALAAFVVAGSILTVALLALLGLLHVVKVPDPRTAFFVSVAGTFVVDAVAVALGIVSAYLAGRVITLKYSVGIGIAMWLIVCAVLCYVLAPHGLTLPFRWNHGFLFEMLAILIAGAIPALYAAYLFVMAKGAVPFAMAPNSDLPSVLKGLYLQRELIPFAVRMQGQDNQTLFNAFGAFLNDVQVDNALNPTQLPGTIRP